LPFPFVSYVRANGARTARARSFSMAWTPTARSSRTRWQRRSHRRQGGQERRPAGLPRLGVGRRLFLPGRRLAVRLQSPGITVAITGPWRKGAL